MPRRNPSQWYYPMPAHAGVGPANHNAVLSVKKGAHMLTRHATPSRDLVRLADSPGDMVGLRARIHRRLCLMDAQIRTFIEHPEEGAVTAEYAVVLVAATGFAALLVTILKSDAVKTLLMNIIKKALNIG